MEDECFENVTDVGADVFDELPASVGDRDCLQRFIAVYESFPELWNKALPSYMNKYKKKNSIRKTSYNIQRNKAKRHSQGRYQKIEHSTFKF